MTSPAASGRGSYRYDEVEALLASREVAGRLSLADLPTPALVLDLDRFEANVARMAAHARARGRALRPHGKTHKCPEIANILIRAGAIGCCAAKLSEAEVFAAHGVTGLLVTVPVLGRHKIERAVALAGRHPETIFVVDDAANARDLDAAAAADPRGPARLNVAIDLLLTARTGVEPGEPALALARVIASLPRLRLQGLQAYDGRASHTLGFDNRRARSLDTMGQAVATRRLLESGGIPCPWLSGGSTGTYAIDSEIDGVTEIQPGSFIFMDLEYSRIGGVRGPHYDDFQQALSVVTTVISKRPGWAIVDAGFKAFSTDRPFTPEPHEPEGAVYTWAGDEHGRLDLSHAGRDVALGERITFGIPHCDPCVNLYDRIHGVRGDSVEVVWPIAARGKSQ